MVLDTVRADHLSAYGYERRTTPSLERLAARGVRFAQAQAPAPWTVPSMGSLWTGTAPTRHGAGLDVEPGELRRFAGRNTIRGFDEGIPTLPGRLREAGYATFGRIANPLLNLDCFTSAFDDVLVERSGADEVVDWALARVDQLTQEPFFLYLHLMDAHVPLKLPPDKLLRFVDPEQLSEMTPTQVAALQRGARVFKGMAGTRERSAKLNAFVESRVAGYDAALRFMDDEIDRLLEQLEQAGVLDDTLVVITADHGEAFWDHLELELDSYLEETRPHLGYAHGHTLFEELLAVPLVLAGPGIPAGRVVESRISLNDVAGTIMELVDPARRLGDASLMSWLREDEAPGGAGGVARRATYSEGISFGHELKTVVDAQGYKLIRATHPDEKDLLFDLKADPGETENLSARLPEVADRLRQEVTRISDALERSRFKPGSTDAGVDAETLRELGYLQDDDG